MGKYFVLAIFLFSLTLFSAGTREQRKADEVVNKHITTTNKKMEIDKKKTATELKIKAKIPPSPPDNKTNPAESIGVDLQEQENAFNPLQEPYVDPSYPDPGLEIQREISVDKHSAAEQEIEKKETVKRIKKAAEEAGYKVNVIPAGSSN